MNYTLTNLAEHLEGVSHDLVNRYLGAEKLTPRRLWEKVKGDVKASKVGYVVRTYAFYSFSLWEKVGMRGSIKSCYIQDLNESEP